MQGIKKETCEVCKKKSVKKNSSCKRCKRNVCPDCFKQKINVLVKIQAKITLSMTTVCDACKLEVANIKKFKQSNKLKFSTESKIGLKLLKAVSNSSPESQQEEYREALKELNIQVYNQILLHQLSKCNEVHLNTQIQHHYRVLFTIITYQEVRSLAYSCFVDFFQFNILNIYYYYKDQLSHINIFQQSIQSIIYQHIQRERTNNNNSRGKQQKKLVDNLIDLINTNQQKRYHQMILSFFWNHIFCSKIAFY